MFFRRRLLRLLFVFASAMADAAAPRPPAPQPSAPNVILITLDTTRADLMGFLGSKRGLTPNLDALARQSVIFTHAYSQIPLTTASHATILTGTYPQFHQVNDFGVPLAPELPYAPYIFRGGGYHTAAFVGSLVLDPDTRSAPGFERGFDTYDAGFHRRHAGEDRYQAIERRGGEVIAHTLDWLTAHREGPFFIWVHLYDAHDPYDPPEPYKTRYAAAPYDGEIAYEDAAVGKFLSWLRLRGLYDGALIAVMADHGEALGDHGETTHGIFLYDETIHVPLLFKLPGERSGGTRVDDRAGLVDVLPTILEAVGIAVPKEVQGESLLSLVKPVASNRSPFCLAVREGKVQRLSCLPLLTIVPCMRKAIIHTALLDGVRCVRCGRENIYSSMRRARSFTISRRIRRRSAICRQILWPSPTPLPANSLLSARGLALRRKRLR
jgi:arylsulfatase A-like enzyme